MCELSAQELNTVDTSTLSADLRSDGRLDKHEGGSAKQKQLQQQAYLFKSLFRYISAYVPPGDVLAATLAGVMMRFRAWMGRSGPWWGGEEGEAGARDELEAPCRGEGGFGFGQGRGEERRGEERRGERREEEGRGGGRGGGAGGCTSFTSSTSICTLCTPGPRRGTR